MMRHLVLLFCLAFTIESNARTLENSGKSSENPKVALLGVFHFGGTTDFSSVEFESLASEKRQSEISEVVEKLKKYQPTKIMLEYPSAQSDYVDRLYTASVTGERKLIIDEREQLGFRLAMELNHPKVYAIDYKMDLPFEELMAFAEQHDQQRLEQVMNSVKKQDKKESEYLSENSLVDYLIYRNSEDEDIRNKDQYLNQSAKFTNDSSYVGAKFVSTWWERNIHMMTNIDQWISDGDRILVIVGAAHRAVLRDFFEDRLDVDYVEIRNYLEE